MSDKTELLPCPFCGGDAASDAHAEDCYFSVLEAFKKALNNADMSLAQEVLRAWNCRAALAQQPATAFPADVRALLEELAQYAPPEGVIVAPTAAMAMGRKAKRMLAAMAMGRKAKRMLAAAPAAPVAQEPVAWVSVVDRMPESGVTVLACYTNSHGKLRRIRAEYVAPKSRAADYPCDSAEECVEYDEATDQHYWMPGWYECVDNWSDYTSLAVTEGEVSHWMPLPAAPGETAPPAAEQPHPLEQFTDACGRLHSACNQVRDKLAEMNAAEQSEKLLDEAAKVGAVRFHAGVPERLVIECAQRHFRYEQSPTFSDDQIAGLAHAIGSAEQPDTVPVPRELLERHLDEVGEYKWDTYDELRALLGKEGEA